MSGPIIITSEVAKILYERRQMRERLSPFIKKVFSTVDPKATYEHNWHIDVIAEHLEALYDGDILKLIINIPPRFLKTICSSIAFPAWVLGKEPSERILVSSYADKLSQRISTDCRTVMETEWYKATFPNTRFAKDQNQKSFYVTTERGYRMSTTVNSNITGEGGNYLICDDPINPKKALSQKIRDDANDWYDQTWFKRKNDPKTSRELVIMQRLHVNDTTGYLLSQDDTWTHLILPQVAEKKTIIIFPKSHKKMVREKDSYLHAARFGEIEIEASKKRLGTYGFAGQEQQRPAPLGGGRIKLDWFKRYRELPVEIDETVMTLDTASGGKAINNPTVCEIYKRSGSVWYLVHVWKESVRYSALGKKVKSLQAEYKADAILIENKSSGISLIQDLQDSKTVNYPVIGIEPEADKITRMDTQTPSLEAGLIALPDIDYFPNCTWLNGLETNLSTFPNCAEWDEIDAMSQFIKWTKQREENVVVVVPHMSTGTSHWRRR